MLSGVHLQLDLDPDVDLQEALEAFSDGVVQRNVAFFERFDLAIDPETNGLFKYEYPRMDGDAQVISDAPTIISRKRATCFDWAAFVAAWIRVKQGIPAVVRIMPRPSVYGHHVQDWHAFVETPASGLVDVCTLLSGYGESDREPYAAVGAAGACCMDCAWDGTLAQHDTCTGCARGHGARG